VNAEPAYAVAFTARERAELVPAEEPSAPPGPREVAGRTLASVISTGTELAVYQLAESFPARTGYAAVFEVGEVGAEITDVKPADRLLCLGPHQSRQRVTRDEAVLVPEGLAPEVAAFARMMTVSMSTLTTTTARPPEKVLVTGLGLVGNLAAQVFAACGYEVIASEPDARRRDLARRVGIGAVFPTVPVDDPSIAGQVGLALECSGHEQAVLDACRVVRKRGEVVLVATPWRRRSDIYAHEVLRAAFHNYVVLRSGWEWELPRHRTDFQVNSIFGNFAGALRWLAEGRVRVDGLYALRPPREAPQAYQDLLHARAEGLTFVFDWGDCP